MYLPVKEVIALSREKPLRNIRRVEEPAEEEPEDLEVVVRDARAVRVRGVVIRHDVVHDGRY